MEVGDGVTFPFSRGCSFIVLDGEGRIRAVRDVVEPASKPGDSTLALLGALAPVVRQLRPDLSAGLPTTALGLWGLYAGGPGGGGGGGGGGPSWRAAWMGLLGPPLPRQAAAPRSRPARAMPGGRGA